MAGKYGKVLLALGMVLLLSVSGAGAADKKVEVKEVKPDPETGRQINGVCAACHGDSGQGGKKGAYPRLAGQNYEYLKKQLHKFKSRQRVNLPMFPYTEERELPDEDIVHIAAYLSAIKLDSALPVFAETDDALTRLQKMEKVLQIPRAEGDVEAGQKIYRQECASCHGIKGLGRKEIPALAGQYTVYLKHQIDLFKKRERIHDEDSPNKDILDDFKEEEIRDILAYISTLDD